MDKIYTTRTGAPLLGIKQDTLKIYAIQSGIGFQPGGTSTSYLFTLEDLLAMRDWMMNRKRGRQVKTQKNEDRDALGVGPLYDKDGKPHE